MAEVIVNESPLMGRVKEVNSFIYNKYRVEQAREIIKIAIKEFGKIAVAFSGGKDSLVALHLTLQEYPEPLVIFNNTTIEFPETIEYVKKLEKELGIKIHIVSPEKSFFKLVKEFGWASHGNRWCCQIIKDGPGEKFIEKLGIKAEITGVTRHESLYRRYVKPFTVYTNSTIIRVNPIYDWNEHEVWGYIKFNNLPYNPLYDLKYKRIGCWCCPLNGLSHYKRLKKTHPSLFQFLANFSPQHPTIRKLMSSSEDKAGDSNEW